MQLTGLGTPQFQTCIDNLHIIHTTFSRHVPEGTLEPFQPSEFLNHPCVNISTRYFTSRREDPTGTAVAFPNTVDPKGILQSCSTNDHFHGQDNEVLYYASDKNKPPRFLFYLPPMIFYKLTLSSQIHDD